MMREHRDYTQRAAHRTFDGFDADQPVAGFYRTRLKSGGVHVAVRVWFGPPKDPVTGEELDRSHRWQAEANGSYIDLDRVWPKCADEPIGAQEYAYLLARSEWASEHAPESPQANPHLPVNYLTAPLPF
jgi:hypothetical protein